MSGSVGRHAPKFGVDFIHEPVLSGAFRVRQKRFIPSPKILRSISPTRDQLTQELNCLPPFDGSNCQTTSTPAGYGGFNQNVQRLGIYAMDQWRVTPQLTINYGLRYDTTFGLFQASGVSQQFNPGVQTIQGLQLPLATGVPHDYRKAFAPRIGIAYSPDQVEDLVLRVGFGVYYSDLAQNGWATAFQAVNTPSAFQPCAMPGDAGCLPGSADGGAANVIDPNYHTPYALHATVGVQYLWHKNWTMSADYVYEKGVHGYARYNYTAGIHCSRRCSHRTRHPDGECADISVFKTDNRSAYNALMLHLQGNVNRRFNLTANYVSPAPIPMATY